MKLEKALLLILKKSKEILDTDPKDFSDWYLVYMLANSGLGLSPEPDERDVEWSIRRVLAEAK